MRAASSNDTPDARAQRAAVAELDAWDEPNFARIGAALRRRHPQVADYLFRGLAAAKRAGAVKSVAGLLGRLDVLEQGSDPRRQATSVRRDDQQAIALLAGRGLDGAERARLRKLVRTALGPTAALTATQLGGTGRRAALLELRAWLDEWATAARAVLKNRSHLIRLGLAARKPPTPG